MTSEFVGRKPELEQLRAHLVAAIGGQGRVALVSGEAGIGKTSLVERFLMLASRHYPEVSIARGRCSERFGGGEGYLPFIEALTGLLEGRQEKSVRDKLLDIVLETAPSWLEAVPAVGQALRASYQTAQAVQNRFGGESPEVAAPDRDHVLREYGGVLARLSEESPLLLFVDDLQWSDAASVDLLVHLSLRISRNRILVLGTYRPSDVDVGRDGKPHPLRQAVLDMRRYDACEEMSLDRLGRGECNAMIAAEFPQNDFPPSLLDLLYQHSEGNALFVSETLRLLKEQGLIERRDETWSLMESVDDLPLPDSVESLVIVRLDRLQEDLRRALRYASVEGERFLSIVLAQVLEIDELALEERLDIVERAHRLVETEGELEIGWDLATVYKFTHFLFQDVLYDRLKPKERVLLHRRTGLALEEVYGDAPAEVAPELALHFFEGRAYDKALQYALIAGRSAQRLYAAREAVGHYERAERLLERVPDVDSEQQLVLQEGLGDMRAMLAEYDSALEHYDRARDLLRAGPGADERLAGLCRKTATVYERKGSYQVAFEWLERGLDYAGDQAPLEVARIRLLGAGIYSRQGRHREALDWCKESLAIARRQGSQSVLAHAAYLVGTIHGHLGRYQEAVGYSRQGLELYEKLADPAGQIKALNNLGAAARGLGNWEAAVEHYRRGIELAEEIGDINSTAIMTHNLANVQLEQGRVGLAARAYQRSLETWQASGFPFGVAASWSGLGKTYIECAEWERALECLARSERKLEEIESDLFLPEVYRRQAVVSLNTGELEKARELADRSVALANDLEMALEKGISLRVSGEVSLACEQWEESETALRESLEILREQGNQYQMAETLYQLGRLYRAGLGEMDGASATRAELVLGKAREIFERLGAQRSLKRVEEASE